MKEEENGKEKKGFAAKAKRFAGWFIVSVLGFVILLLILIQLPFVQNYGRKKLVSYLGEKLGTHVEIGRLTIRFPTNITLEKVYFEDKSQDTLLFGDQLKVNMSMLRLLKREVVIREIGLQGIVANIRRSPSDSSYNFQFIVDAFSGSEPTKTTSKSAPFSIDIKKIQIGRSRFTFSDSLSHVELKSMIGDAQLQIHAIDPEQNIFDIAMLSLARSNIIAQTNSATDPTSNPNTSDTASGPPLRVIARQIGISESSFTLDDTGQPEAPEGIDYAHLRLSDIYFRASGLTYNPDTTKAVIEAASFTEKSGFKLDDFKADFDMNPTGFSLQNLLIKTPGSMIGNQVTLSYPSVEAISQNPESLGLFVNLQDTKISAKDLWTFMPDLRNEIPLSPDEYILVNTKLSGKVNDLLIQQLDIRGLSGTHLQLHGSVKGIPDTKKTTADLNIQTMNTNQRDLTILLPTGTLPAGITIPQKITLQGRIRGGVNKVYTKLQMNTEFGGVNLEGNAENVMDSRRSGYQVSLRADKLQAGNLLQNPDLGIFNGSIRAVGKGYEPHTAQASFTLLISSADYHQYRYQNISAMGTIENADIHTDLHIRDKNLSAQLNIGSNFSGSYPSLNMSGVIDSVDVQALHFSPSILKFRGNLSADFPNTNPDSLMGELLITNSVLQQKNQNISLDTISLVAHSGDTNSLALNTDIGSVLIKGKYRITQIRDIFTNTLNPYFTISENKISTKKTDPYHFTITAAMEDNPITLALIPGIKDLQTIRLFARIDSDSGLNLAISSPHIKYNDLIVDSVNITGNTQDSALTFNILMKQLTSGSTFEIHQTRLQGKAEDNRINFSLAIADAMSKEKYHLAGELNRLEDKDFTFHLLPDSLMLNYQPWRTNDQNKITFGKDKLVADSVMIAHENEQLFLQSAKTEESTPPLIANFSNFHLSTLAGLFLSDSLQLGGLLNGQATVTNVMTTPAFVSNLTIDDLRLDNDTLGNLAMKINNSVKDLYQANISLRGANNDIDISGTYSTETDRGSFDLQAVVNRLQLSALSTLLQNNISRADGYLYGKATLQGTPDDPKINGKFQFQNASFVPKMLNNVFKIDNKAALIVSNSGISFESFSLRDTSDNSLTLSGQINTTDWKKYGFDMRLVARDFQVANSTARDNNLFYGKFTLSSRLNIKGTLQQPVIDGSLSVGRNTDFTVLLPSEDPQIESREGIVRFVDFSAAKEDSILMLPYDSLREAPFTGYDVSVSISIDKEASFKLIVDRANGDYLSMKGTGQLNAEVNPGGKISLTGTYEIEEGSYLLSINLIKKRFQIRKGSKITWTGDPLTANVDITASYQTKTAPYNLVANTISESSLIFYRQKLQFDVLLKMQGDLLKPEVSFDIQLPDENTTLSSSVTNSIQERLSELRRESSEMNTQVFALMLLNNFMGENPFSQAGSGSAESVARRSASRLLTDQLNNLADNLIQGVDIDFNLQSSEDFSTGQKEDRTNLQLNLSKSLLNDRLTVSVGNNFQLDGQQQAAQEHTGIADNVALNYKLSKDGRYMLRAYRKNDLTGTIEGYVIETGIGFSINVDYNKFSSLFLSKKQRRRRRDIRKYNRDIDRSEKAGQKKTEETFPTSKPGNNDE